MVSSNRQVAMPAFYDKLVDIAVDKAALIEAGGDIVNLAFEGQNLRDADVTRIVAGRDIMDTPLRQDVVTPSLVLGGPGSFDVEAGRNIGAVDQSERCLHCERQQRRFCCGQHGYRCDRQCRQTRTCRTKAPAFRCCSASLPASTIPRSLRTTSIRLRPTLPVCRAQPPALIAFMEQYDEGQGVDTGLVANAPTPVVLTASQAFAQFQALPNYVQQLFIGQVFFDVLTDVGNDFHNPASPFANQYARGFQAINTLFPASFGYTANNLGGGSNGSNAPVSTGNLDIRSTTIQTQQGGSVSILGPGGEALVGSSSAPPAIVNANGQIVAGPGTMGILTLEQGDINIFTDQSLLLAQSRVFTEQGGNITIWSSNGDINAGQGSTTVANIPPPEYVCDVNHFCALDTKGEVAGAGIGTLQTIPGAPRGNANLLAPRGTVDAGAAGIRVSGNLNIAALAVANVANIQVQGTTTGVTAAAPNAGALSDASAASGAATKAITATNQGNNNTGQPSILIVEIEGYGGDDGSEPVQQPQSPTARTQARPSKL